MVKFKTILIVLLTFLSLNLLSQSGSYSINSETKQVTNFEAKYVFNSVSTYDNDLKEYLSKFPTQTTVVIKISADGTGSLFTKQYGYEKHTYKITKCLKYDNYFVFYWTPVYNANNNRFILFLENNRVSCLESKGDKNNVSIIWR